jgi:hypothetical protein
MKGHLPNSWLGIRKVGKCGRHIHVCEWNKIKTSHSEKKRVKKKRREGRGKKREEKRERRERR